MLYITTNEPRRVKREYQWHVGEPLVDLDPTHIVSIQADGDELFHIGETCPLSIVVSKPVLVFYGCIAQTIYANL